LARLFFTYAVEAIWPVLSLVEAVLVVGVPVRAGEANGATPAVTSCGSVTAHVRVMIDDTPATGDH
jgi:hypothetical protein